MEIKLKPFMTPNFVLPEASPGQRQDGYHPLPSIPLREVPAEDLEKLCAEFRLEVFRKAGKTPPSNGEAGR